MSYTLWSQDVFSKGELSPFMYARATVNEYGNGLKKAQNVLTYPTGAAGKRFGTLYQATLHYVTGFNQLYFQTFQYLNECVYQLSFTPGNIEIYLEGILIATVSNSLNQNQIFNMNTTVLGPLFRVCYPGLTNHPFDLTRSPNSPATITSHTSTTFSASSAPFTAGLIYPVQFSVTGGTILQTNPAITVGVTYFVAATSTTTGVIFATAQNAKAFLQNQSDFTNAFSITGSGTGTTSVIVLNTWTFAHTTFKNVPIYDFNGSSTSYDSLTFTPSATQGTGVTITVSGSGYSPLNSSYVGGAFIGDGGTSRITAVASATSFTVSVQSPFDSTDPIQGSLAILAEPAWSDTRGWPQVCSSYQNRALFANTASLPNGFYGSVINDYTDFGDLTNNDDDAISWYPTSDNMNFIRFIVPYRSITVHTNTGIYSSPLSDVVAITPSNFTLQLQDSTPADVLQPQAIDNQVLVLSGNDAHQMLWDGINNAYTSNIVSVINEQTIRNPIDEVAYQDLHRAGSRFVLIINSNGSMAAFQTLLAQNVSGFTPQIMEQSYGNASFIQAASSAEGRCWFVVEREIANSQNAIALSAFPISNYTSNTLHSVSSAFSTTVPTEVTFDIIPAMSGSLPTSSPQILTHTNYWVVGTNSNDFKVYTSLFDAENNNNPITFSNSGNNSEVIPVNTLRANSSNFSTLIPTAITFEDTTTLPTSNPQITTTQYYWAIGTDANDFMVYLTQEDAIAGVNNITFSSTGQDASVIAWPLTTIFTLEELTSETFLDCAVFYSGTPTDVVTTGALFNAQDVAMVGDGFGFFSPGENNINNEIVFNAHGSSVNVSQAYIGFPINTIIEPMPLSISNGYSGKSTTLTKPKHIRFVNFMFTQTIGGTINGVPISLEPFDMANIGEPPIPATGIMQMSVFKDWDDFNNPSYTIEHSDPFNIILLGVFYAVDI